MKKILAIVLLAGAPLTAFADNDVGCGLGTQVWVGKSGVVPKVLAATTNGTFGNQTFGITSGTLGCSSGGVIKAEYRAPAFAAANIDQLASDMATGQGESLEALATIYGIEGADRAAFFAMTKTNYGQIFASSSTTSTDVVASVETLMKADARLSRYVA